MNREISDKIFKVLDSRPQISTYTITGYRLLETRLVIHYHDCDEVFDFMDCDGKVTMNRFFTKNYEGDGYLDSIKHFSELHEKCQPETI